MFGFIKISLTENISPFTSTIKQSTISDYASLEFIAGRFCILMHKINVKVQIYKLMQAFKII